MELTVSRLIVLFPEVLPFCHLVASAGNCYACFGGSIAAGEPYELRDTMIPGNPRRPASPLRKFADDVRYSSGEQGGIFTVDWPAFYK